MSLTNAEEAEINYCKYLISLKKEKIKELELDTPALLAKAVKQIGIREFFIQGEKVDKLKKEIEKLEARILQIENKG